MENRNGSNDVGAKPRRGGSREAIVEAAERLFLERGFGAVSMDELAEAASVARRTLYNQFSSKEEIFREMLLRVSGQLEHAFPPGVETQGDVEDVLRLVARMILELHKHREYLGFLRMVVADSRQFPWIAEEFATVMDPQTERLVRYLAHLTALGILDCRNPMLAAHQFMGMLNELSLWPWMMGREGLPVSRRRSRRDDPDVPSALPEHYRRAEAKGDGDAVNSSLRRNKLPRRGDARLTMWLSRNVPRVSYQKGVSSVPVKGQFNLRRLRLKGRSAPAIWDAVLAV